MDKIIQNLRNASVGTKLSLMAFVLISIVFGIYAWTIGYSTTKVVEQRAITEVTSKNQAVVDMIEMFDNAVRSEAGHFAKLLASNFPDKFSIDTSRTVDVAGKVTPVLKNGNADINLDFSIPDRFTAQSGVTATIFVKTRDDFIRISTSVKKENGERAVGTILDHAHPGYARLLAGESYLGVATLFGKQYMTEYDPIKDASGNVVGVLYVGVNISDDIKRLKDKIKSIKVGETGYFYVLDAKKGPGYGTLLVHPAQEGTNLLGSKDPNGREFIKEILEKKQGWISYPWINTALGEKTPREKIVAFTTVDNWNWTIAGGAYKDEIVKEVTELRNSYAVWAIVAVLVLVTLLFFIIRRMVSSPIGEATKAARQLATGDLTATLKVDRTDEIGQLMESMNGVSQGLARVVAEVRSGTEQITVASREIAVGNADLSARTESQASSLEETASSMEELTSTVKQNADNARQANGLARSASEIALKGGTVVSQVVDTMASINDSSKKIVDIISVIDGIAFQTNILALNAAVEAARAGEQGRGFAVVATEVRNLAQRSAAAAKEIKALIGDSVDKVDNGAKLVDQAGATMQEIVESVKRVTDIIGEIAAASEEQTSGIEQVNQAITQMDHVTQQNASLVEEAAAASEAMQDQAKSLAQAVSVFKISGMETAVTAPAVNSLKAKPSITSLAKQSPQAGLKVTAPQPRRAARTEPVTGDEWEQF